MIGISIQLAAIAVILVCILWVLLRIYNEK